MNILSLKLLSNFTNFAEFIHEKIIACIYFPRKQFPSLFHQTKICVSRNSCNGFPNN